jgi:hypothetical protein
LFFRQLFAQVLSIAFCGGMKVYSFLYTGPHEVIRKSILAIDSVFFIINFK